MESSFQPPVRKSLTDEELAARVNLATSSHSGIEAVMELLVAQEALRAQEDAEIALWVTQMENDGSPQAQRALENFRRSSQGLDPVDESHAEPATDAHLIHAEAEEVPQVEELNQGEPEIVESPQTPFSWFTRTQETPIVPEPEVVEPEVVEPEVVEPEVVEPVAQELHPEGSESLDAFDHLLAAASAEEELTALEDSKVRVSVREEEMVSNVAIPSDEHRVRKPLSQVFIWLGVSATLVPILLVVALVGFGLSASAIAMDLTVGYLVSGLLISVASLAGKRSGLSTSMVSRAVFGVWGNSLPLSILFVVRATITALILSVFTFLLDGVEIRLPGFDYVVTSVLGISLTVGLVVQLLLLVVVVLVTSAKGFISRTIQMMLSMFAFVLVLESFLGLPIGSMQLSASGQSGIESKESMAGIATVIMVTLTLWFAVAPNLAKSIPMKHRGIKVFASVLLANFLVPVVVAIIALLWLGNATSGLAGTVMLLPKWSSGALVSGIAVALVYATLLSVKTATLDLVALVRVRSSVLTAAISLVVVSALLVLFAQQPTNQKLEYLLNVFVLVSALTAGWVGMFAADVSLRRIAYHELSLSRAYGFYKKFNVLSVSIWLVTLISAVAFMPVNLYGLSFFGFALPLIGFDSNIGSAALGYVITVLLGIVLTTATRIPQIRKQESEVLAVESRREQLNDIFVGQE